MDIKKTFRKDLLETELFSSEDNQGDFKLDVSKIYLSKGVLPDQELDVKMQALSSLPLSKSLETELIEIYTQISLLELGWDLTANFEFDKLLSIDYIKNECKAEDLSSKDYKDIITGAINLVRPMDMIDQKTFGYLEKNGNKYYPFDLHFETIASFKMENDTIENNIYLYNTQDSDNIIDMNVTAKHYLQLAYEAKCFKNWQYAYALKESQYNERLLGILPDFFPFLELNLERFK